MDVLRRLGGEGAKEGTVVVADEQTSGRGRFRREWITMPRQDLLLSILFKPRPALAGELQIIAALAVADAVDIHTGRQTRIKWPNDILVDGAKIAGVLVEGTQDAGGLSVVVGVGLNVNSELSARQSGGLAAVSMHDVSGRLFRRVEVLRTLLGSLDGYYAALKLGETLVPPWRSRLETIGKRVTVRVGPPDAPQKVVIGVAEDVDASGRLLVRETNGRLSPMAAGEVTLQS